MFARFKWALSLRIKPAEKLILLALVEKTDSKGGCFPSIRLLAEQCCVSERTVQRTLKRFEANGWLKIEARWRDKNAGQTSNGYQLLIEPSENKPTENASHSPDNLSPSPRQIVRGGVTQLCHPPGDIAVSPHELPTELSIEDVVPEQAVDNRRLRMPDRFNAKESADAAVLLHSIASDAAQLLLDEVAGAMRKPGTIKTTPMRFLRALIKKHQKGDFRPYRGIPSPDHAERKENAAKAGKSADSSIATAHLAQITRMLRGNASTPTDRETTGPPSGRRSA
ncbi:helix-turn-helix domain-containing protein [Pseudomonas sp. S 311-6]|uniref:helix-turn-helix domain-containing protein n=1 Tax=Kerstersia gyiorum TaxID=206506 RepID=UPI0020986772|nr:helix-turn-helix domain-containing protein [Pseudomonas sp. S 311-6]